MQLALNNFTKQEQKNAPCINQIAKTNGIKVNCKMEIAQNIIFIKNCTNHNTKPS